jgi:hypothetical protein
VSWHQPIANQWLIIPRLRYYSQTEAAFYQATGTHLESTFFSSDYRLASFGALSGGIKLSKDITHLKTLKQLKFQTGIEYYDHNADFQLTGNNNNHFTDFSYYLVTASFNLRF